MIQPPSGNSISAKNEEALGERLVKRTKMRLTREGAGGENENIIGPFAQGPELPAREAIDDSFDRLTERVIDDDSFSFCCHLK